LATCEHADDATGNSDRSSNSSLAVESTARCHRPAPDQSGPTLDLKPATAEVAPQRFLRGRSKAAVVERVKRHLVPPGQEPQSPAHGGAHGARGESAQLSFREPVATSPRHDAAIAAAPMSPCAVPPLSLALSSASPRAMAAMLPGAGVDQAARSEPDANIAAGRAAVGIDVEPLAANRDCGRPGVITKSGAPPPAPRVVQRQGPEPLFDERGVAAILNMSPATLRNWRVNGLGPMFVRLSRRCIRYRPADVDAWLVARLARSTSDGGRGGADA
jgi:hypothetical protein